MIPIAAGAIWQPLQQLASQTGALASHAVSTDIGFDYLGRSLARYSAEAYQHYNARRYASAQAHIQGMTTVCIACHSKRPSPSDSPFAEGFVSESQLAKLPLVQRAQLQMATRQFDAAISSYERLFADPSIHPAELIAGPLTGYLILCIRVKGDLSRLVASLKALTHRPKLWRSLQADLGHRISVMQTRRDELKRPPTLAKGRELIDAALAATTYPMQRRPLIDYIVASSLLNRFIEAQVSERLQTAEIAEAYYLLGLAEYRIDRDFWVSQAGRYLEASIRIAPDKPFAQQAFALLEEETIVGFTGSTGTVVPSILTSRAVWSMNDQRTKNERRPTA